MDAIRFDRLARSLTATSSRRTILTRLAGATVAAVAVQLPGGAGAKNKKKKRKNPSPNEHGCLNVGQACRGNDGNCCSGICQGTQPKKGKKDKSRCVAHHASTCQMTDNFCAGTVTGCGTNGVCARTTGGASFCANVNAPSDCASCGKDQDCEATHGPGAACVVCEAGCPVGRHTGCVSADLGTAI